MKSYTDLEQSKKLAEILPIESADMEFMFLKRDNSMVSRVPFVKDGTEEPDCSYNMVPAWSLAALLEELDDEITDEEGNDYTLTIVKENLQYQLYYRHVWDQTQDIEIDYYDDMVDACYEMIIKLYKLNLL